MKKSAKNRIIVWSIVSGLLIAVLVLGIINIQNIATFAVTPINIANIKNLDDYVSGEAEFERDKIVSLDVNWASGEINVSRGDTDKVVISEDSDSENVDDRMCWYLHNNGTLSIYSSKKSNVFFGLSFDKNKSKNLNIELPANMSFDDLHISSANADINVEFAIAEKVIVENATGNIDIKGIESDNVDITNVSGRIDVTCEKAREVSVSSVSGQINVKGDYREIDTESVSGSTNVYAGKDIISIDSDAVSGSIDVSVSNEISGFIAEYESVSGSFDCDFNGKSNVDEFVYGDGKVEINLETVSGSMSVKSI